jgi:hypothetical protein
VLDLLNEQELATSVRNLISLLALLGIADYFYVLYRPQTLICSDPGAL